METRIQPATSEDLPLIYKLFEEAISFQRQNKYIGWPSYDKDFIKSDVENQLLFKVTNGNDVLAIFCICLTDKLIWREREKHDALYLHRIVLNRKFQGVKIFQTILAWSREFVQKHQRKFVRMDTWAENAKLIDYYKSYGFRFIENYTTADTVDLPVQHRNLNVALLELEVPPTNQSLTLQIANEFARDWIDAWNSHDIEKIISHYDESIEFYSPFIRLLNFNSSGMIDSKSELKKYFEIGLNAYPDLRFDLHNVFTGVESIVLQYTSVKGKLAAETFLLNGHGKAIKVYCHYL